jgi:adenine phosphoribosyltransferase
VTLDQIKKLIRDVPNFPRHGIVFKDITPVLSHPTGFHSLIEMMSELVPNKTNKIVAVESRGFILGAAIAKARGLGLVLVRKPGKLPHKTISHSYKLEYGTDTLHMHADALSGEDLVTIVDDVLATGGTAGAAEELCFQTGANVLQHVFMMELSFLAGKDRLRAPSRSLIVL